MVGLAPIEGGMCAGDFFDIGSCGALKGDVDVVEVEVDGRRN